MLSGDCVPVRGDMPVYDDVKASMDSINKLLARKGIKVLLSAWAEPAYGQQVYKNLQDGLDYMADIDHEVYVHNIAGEDFLAIVNAVHNKLGLTADSMNPLFFNTIKAHVFAGYH